MDINLKELAEKQWEKEDRENFRFYECQACGAKFFSEDVLNRCIYCGNDMIIPCGNESLRPDGIIPFSVDKNQAASMFRRFCRGKKLIPKSLAELDFDKETKGIYMPVWVLNAKGKTKASFKAFKGEAFKKGKIEGIKKDFYTLKREGEASFENCILKTDKVRGFMKDIEPYYFSEAKAFDSQYLKGFLSDKFDEGKDEAYKNICAAIEKGLAAEYKGDITGFSNAQAESIEVFFDTEDLKYILAPVWLMNFKYDGEIYPFAVNGQTGNFTGKAPVGRGEYLKYFIICFAVIAVIGIIIAFLI